MKYITIIYGNKDMWQSFTPGRGGKGHRRGGRLQPAVQGVR